MKNTLKIDTLVQEDGTEIKIEDLAPEQKYLHSQILDLSNKQRRVQFELDQVNAMFFISHSPFLCFLLFLLVLKNQQKLFGKQINLH